MPIRIEAWGCIHCFQRFKTEEAATQHEQSHMTTVSITYSGKPDPSVRARFVARELTADVA